MCPSTHRSLLGAIIFLGFGVAVAGCGGAEAFRAGTDGGSPFKTGGTGGSIATGGSGGLDLDAGGGTGGTPEGTGGAPAGTGGSETGGSGGGSGGAAGSGGAMDAGSDTPMGGSGGRAGSGGSGGTGGTVDAGVDRVDAGGGAGGTDVPQINGCLNTNWMIAANTLCTTSQACAGIPASDKDPHYAIDGDIVTRYTSGVQQGSPAQDETVTLTFPRTVTISGIRLRTTKPGDGVAIYRLEYSTNATTFMGFPTAVTGPGADDLTIPFPATAMRAIRIVQIGATSLAWWSIHELTVLGCVNS
jgi:hypothetical protein